LGLTTGILDSVALGNCLLRIINRGETIDLLDRYSKVRRDAWVNYTNPQSIDFKKRVHFFDPETIESRAAFFAHLNSGPEFSTKMARAMNEVIEDEFELAPIADATQKTAANESSYPTEISA
jgi:hypothetical protein